MESYSTQNIITWDRNTLRGFRTETHSQASAYFSLHNLGKEENKKGTFTIYIQEEKKKKKKKKQLHPWDGVRNVFRLHPVTAV